jgi:hypothetical protein
MEQHLPNVYTAFRDAHPEVANALDELGRSTEQAGPLDARVQRLVKLALAVGSLAQGARRGRHSSGGPTRCSARDHHLRLPDGNRGTRVD